MLAGNVTAAVVGGVVQISGDNVANGIVITQGSTGDLIVSGVSAGSTATPTTINGSDGPVTLPGSAGAAVNITTGKGADVVQVYSVTLGPSPAGLTIDTGQGDDEVVTGIGVFIAGNVSINTGQGDDFVLQQLVVASGSMSIDTGQGKDSIEQFGVYTGGNLSIQTGQDDDLDLMNGVVVGYITPSALLVSTGQGDDAVSLTDVVYAGSATLDGGQGTDTLGRMEYFHTVTQPTILNFESVF